jgi:septum formation protein
MSAKTTANAIRPLILASTSRYRRALLARLGVAFTLAAPGIDETAGPGESPPCTALRLAEAKARVVADRFPEAIVIGSDQVAECAGEPVGKPGTRARAVHQLEMLSGRTVVFHTGLAVVAGARCQRELIDVTSTFRALSRAEIDAYLDREQPFDCAGSVKSEGLGIALFDRIASDDPTALIGLPLIALARMLRAEGLDVLRTASPAADEGGTA